MTTRIGEPMTEDQAVTWITSGETPAGACTVTRARKLVRWARDAGAVNLKGGPDLFVPGRLLVRAGDEFEVHPSPARPTTPGHVSHSMEAAGLPLARAGHPGWVTFWDRSAPEAVRVEFHGAGRKAVEQVKRYLDRALWTTELVTETSAAWLRVTQETVAAPLLPARRELHPGDELPVPGPGEITWTTGNLTETGPGEEPSL